MNSPTNPEARKEYAATALKLGIKHRIGKYGIEFGRANAPNGKKYGWKVVRLTPLDGWTFESHEIIEAIANDTDMSISYGEKK